MKEIKPEESTNILLKTSLFSSGASPFYRLDKATLERISDDLRAPLVKVLD